MKIKLVFEIKNLKNFNYKFIFLADLVDNFKANDLLKFKRELALASPSKFKEKIKKIGLKVRLPKGITFCRFFIAFHGINFFLK